TPTPPAAASQIRCGAGALDRSTGSMTKALAKSAIRPKMRTTRKAFMAEKALARPGHSCQDACGACLTHIAPWASSSLTSRPRGGMVDATDLKSVVPKGTCRFKSGRGHHWGFPGVRGYGRVCNRKRRWPLYLADQM